jgi:diadenosine tetraphosphate (Ap4A) HIT family hydrolase
MVHVAYFFESLFEVPQAAKPYHLHIHIIPRFKSLARPGALLVTECGTTWSDAWQVPRLAERMMIPEPYRQSSPAWESRAASLMDYVRHELQTPP